MVKISDLDNYLHADAVRDGDAVEIVGKTKYVSAEESTFDRAYVEITVKLPNGRLKVWTPNKTSLKKIAAVFGDDADLWDGKRVLLRVLEQNVRGEMKGVIYGEPAKDLPKQEVLSK